MSRQPSVVLNLTTAEHTRVLQLAKDLSLRPGQLAARLLQQTLLPSRRLALSVKLQSARAELQEILSLLCECEELDEGLVVRATQVQSLIQELRLELFEADLSSTEHGDER